MVPYLEEESIDHNSCRKGAITSSFSLEEVVMSLTECDDAGCRQAVPPRILIRRLDVPERFRGGKVQGIELVEADSRGVVVGQSKKAEEDVASIVSTPASFIFDPLLVAGLCAFSGFHSDFEFISVFQQPSWDMLALVVLVGNQ